MGRSLSVFINTTSEQVGVCGVYNMFNPLPLYENDTVHKILDLFPGGGSCAAYNSVRVFHWVAFSCSVVGTLLGLHLILLYFIRAQAILTIYLKVMSLVYIVAAGCALIAISVWDGSIAKPSNRGSSSLVPTNYLGHGFWLEVSSLIFSAIVSLAAAVLSETARAAPPPPGAGGSGAEGGNAMKELNAVKAECAAAQEKVQTLQAALAAQGSALQAKEAELASIERAAAAQGAAPPQTGASNSQDPKTGEDAGVGRREHRSAGAVTSDGVDVALKEDK
mmetsp:Transcript_42634/g.110545  ORF Transcript_42634/g.110545 Transcript_42634/m.110545 type:complete len:278 (-) Transcript_42634:171-1004(-)